MQPIINIISVLKKHIKPTDTIIIGVSGGSDSIYLLHNCIKLKCKIIIAHINHKLRGSESDADSEFVKKTAESLDLLFEQKTLKKIPKGNLEEVCRIERYKFFEHLRKLHKAKWILTAHNQNDQIETVIFNLIRGTFLNGLKGMSKIDKKQHLLRPLLDINKVEILKYLKKHRIKFCHDSSNDDLKFSRNILRHQVLPAFKKINPGFEKTFVNTIANLQTAANFIEEYSNNWISKNMNKKSIFLKNFLDLKPIMQKTILAAIYKKLYGNTNKLNQNHIAQILRIINNQKSNRKKEFGNKYFIFIQKNGNKKIITIIARLLQQFSS